MCGNQSLNFIDSKMLNLQLYLIGLTAKPRRDAATNPVFIILIDISTISLNFYNFSLTVKNEVRPMMKH